MTSLGEHVEIFDAGAGIEHHDALTDVDLSGCAKSFERGETGRSLWGNDEAFLRSDLADSSGYFFVVNSDGPAIRLAKNFQDEEIANCFWNAQTGCDRVRVRKFCGNFFSSFEGADDRRATGGLHCEHARPLFADPAEGLHFVERFPHSDKPGAAARGIKNHVGQLPGALLS